MRLIPALIFAASFGAEAATWNEAVNGDLSNDRLDPSQLVLTVGSNVVSGSFGAPDVDYLTVLVPSGHALSSVAYGEGTVIGGVRSFMGVQSGPTVAVPADADSAEGLLGWTHFQQVQVGTNLLPEIGTGFGAMGFVGSLPAGSYTFWIQDTSEEPGLQFAFDLGVTPVPEPEGWLLMTAGLILLGLAARKGSFRSTLK